MRPGVLQGLAGRADITEMRKTKIRRLTLDGPLGIVERGVLAALLAAFLILALRHLAAS
jgi:hypothetical protein